MRSARILFAATATAAALAMTAPGAYALTAGDEWSKDDSAHSWEKDHDKPHGGMHTGSGALSLLSGDEWSKEHDMDENGKKDHDKGKEHEKGKDHEKDGEHEKGGEHEKDYDKPHGGVHTGGGALTVVNGDDWSKPESDSSSKSEEEKKDHDKDWSKEHEKPKGGVHTGGGGLASGGSNVTGALVLAGGVAAFALYRRKKAADAAA
ncbi:hypothetical protein [Streptomyces litmocidini]|uniref:Uncharacterized protein n=1 Tax=Streptomyces litmocidini TaxID=67318 RepID=A0ABW7TZE4_9ACTN